MNYDYLKINVFYFFINIFYPFCWQWTVLWYTLYSDFLHAASSYMKHINYIYYFTTKIYFCMRSGTLCHLDYYFKTNVSVYLLMWRIHVKSSLFTLCSEIYITAYFNSKGCINELIHWIGKKYKNQNIYISPVVHLGSCVCECIHFVH